MRFDIVTVFYGILLTTIGVWFLIMIGRACIDMWALII